MPVKVSADETSEGISRTDGALQGAKMPLIFDSRKLFGFTGDEPTNLKLDQGGQNVAKKAEVINW